MDSRATSITTDDIIEDAFLELLRWQVEVREGVGNGSGSEAAPAPALLHELSLSTASPQWEARLRELAHHVWAARTRFFARQTITDEDCTIVLRLMLTAARPNWPTRLKVSPTQQRDLVHLLALPVPPEVSGTTRWTARPPLGDLNLDDQIVFVRLQSGYKVEWEWRLVLGAAALAARHTSLVLGEAPRVRFGLWNARHAHLLPLDVGDLFPEHRLDHLARTVGRQIVETNWTALGRTSQLARLPGEAASQQHPVLALQAVNGHTKTLAARLRTERTPKRVKALRQQQLYLYEVKERAARVMLERGVLRPVAIEQGTLLAVGDTPLGPRGFHLTLERFMDFADRLNPQDAARQYGSLREAQAVREQYDLDEALQLLVKVITTKGASLGTGRRQ
ncbi:hypothetical protein E5F05_08760 [Deinococcus metallilatus]|uniref:Uncharacterized protein n=1 Tax=Deinococcus metallilatus TaxID=1211322 RepID=A0AAJ5F315_9DEIO|nr:hypothetical protein [Deinococcus metallilatus]MBB5295447.1 hypothetical protein [Deinococcus metallilatus]QBY08031.1 hypothetical protein E5F05_08760 [Deinococcus metallilatus]RXJ12924.1 hypothetical protein ERJ73_07585 [Deinococcus metallilatus]TLK27154.1 hypothetical protein FCS05_09730 [Deinococcus metallilatus]